MLWALLCAKRASYKRKRRPSLGLPPATSAAAEAAAGLGRGMPASNEKGDGPGLGTGASSSLVTSSSTLCLLSPRCFSRGRPWPVWILGGRGEGGGERQEHSGSQQGRVERGEKWGGYFFL